MDAPWGYDEWTHTEVVPKPSPYRWRIGPVSDKTFVPPAQGIEIQPNTQEELTMQLTADQQVELSITGEDAYGNQVEITGDTEWRSSDESILRVDSTDPSTAIAVAVGPVGSASVTVTNDVDNDGTGDFIGSLAIDVVAGRMAEIEIAASDPMDKPPEG
jgi:hypothetical protein